jgi:hypothetical protein
MIAASLRCSVPPGLIAFPIVLPPLTPRFFDAQSLAPQKRFEPRFIPQLEKLLLHRSATNERMAIAIRDLKHLEGAVHFTERSMESHERDRRHIA